jgi:hypothetical protein
MLVLMLSGARNNALHRHHLLLLTHLPFKGNVQTGASTTRHLCVDQQLLQGRSDVLVLLAYGGVWHADIQGRWEMKPKPNMKRIAAADDKIAAAADEMIKGPMYFIEAILRKHEQAVLEVMAEQQDEIKRLQHALENCRLLAARNRDVAWARTVLGFCANAGVVGSTTR